MVEVTKLPPGTAYGATDLQRWSKNRMVGRTSTDEKKQTRGKRIKCKDCQHVAFFKMARPGIKFRCAKCGGANVDVRQHKDARGRFG